MFVSLSVKEIVFVIYLLFRFSVYLLKFIKGVVKTFKRRRVTAFVSIGTEK